MKKNVGKTDTVIRIVLAIVIGALGVYFNTWWGLLGLIPLLTGIFGLCPLYMLVGVRTCPAKTNE
jgi:hypothetical protein